MSKNKQDYNKTGQNEAISNVFSFEYNKYISVHNNIYIFNVRCSPKLHKFA